MSCVGGWKRPIGSKTVFLCWLCTHTLRILLVHVRRGFTRIQRYASKFSFFFNFSFYFLLPFMQLIFKKIALGYIVTFSAEAKFDPLDVTTMEYTRGLKEKMVIRVSVQQGSYYYCYYIYQQLRQFWLNRCARSLICSDLFHVRSSICICACYATRELSSSLYYGANEFAF